MTFICKYGDWHINARKHTNRKVSPKNFLVWTKCRQHVATFWASLLQNARQGRANRHCHTSGKCFDTCAQEGSSLVLCGGSSFCPDKATLAECADPGLARECWMNPAAALLQPSTVLRTMLAGRSSQGGSGHTVFQAVLLSSDAHTNIVQHCCWIANN